MHVYLLLLLSCMHRLVSGLVRPMGVHAGGRQFMRHPAPLPLASRYAIMTTRKDLASASASDELAGFKVAELKEELLRRGLPVSGRKDALIDRLKQAMQPLATRQMTTSSGSGSGVAKSQRRKMAASQVVGDGPAVMIVESPAKCKTIAKFAGSDTVVLASYGHVRSLPSKANSVRPAENFAMDFELVSGAASTLKGLGAALRGARALLLATDPDREGEAIAWHLQEALKERGLLPPSMPVHRVTFTEITERAVQAALAAPRTIDMPLVHAQQARQAVDYLVGFTLSPVLWRKLPGCRSAGRVQSVALRILVEREAEIGAFLPREYWRIKANLVTTDGADDTIGDRGASDHPSRPPALLAELTHLKGERLSQFDLGSEIQTREALAALPQAWLVSKVKRSKRRSEPPAPFNTASLQQEASRSVAVRGRRPRRGRERGPDHLHAD
jgi:hypothetical protein